jgi:UDP-2,3-diacylglucosamine hydrolase
MLFGHRHLPVDIDVEAAGRRGRYINLGDWISYFTYAVFDGHEVELKRRVGDGPLCDDVRVSGGPAV